MKTDKKYEAAINKFIPQAEELAHHEEPRTNYGKDDKESWSAAWNSVYHGEMNRLTREAGLRSL
jgi:hypothetical protein